MFFFRLSGLSPFAGATDLETMASVSSGDLHFNDAAWDDVSDLARDFITKLIVKDKRFLFVDETDWKFVN